MHIGLGLDRDNSSYSSLKHYFLCCQLANFMGEVEVLLKKENQDNGRYGMQDASVNPGIEEPKSSCSTGIYTTGGRNAGQESQSTTAKSASHMDASIDGKSGSYLLASV